MPKFPVPPVPELAEPGDETVMNGRVVVDLSDGSRVHLELCSRRAGCCESRALQLAEPKQLHRAGCAARK